MEDAKPCQTCHQLIMHFAELRTRFFRCFIAFCVTFVTLYAFSAKLTNGLTRPLLQVLPAGQHLIATHITAPLLVPLKLSLALSLFITIPFLLQQLWRFIAPGLYQTERKLAYTLLLASITLFYLGMLFAYAIVFPILFGTLAHMTPSSLTLMPDISSYLNFTLKLLLAFGIAFQTPVIVLFCTASNLLTRQNLNKLRPYVITAAFVMGMLLTPPDVISQVLLAIPIWLLFELGLILDKVLPNKQSTKR